MNRRRTVLVLVATLLFSCAAPRVRAQDNAPKKVTPLKVQAVISEFDGEKKVGSLPYVFYVMADAQHNDRTSVRMGLRVPVRNGGSATPGMNYQYSYQDIGTNLDCSAQAQPDGSFVLSLTIQRSSLYTGGAEVAKENQANGTSVIPDIPIIQNFSTSTLISAKDGQTVQTNLAADPINGHLLKVDLTVNVVK